MLVLVNADNVSGEGLPYLIDGLMERGAASVHAVPAITKKGRSEFLFFIDAPRSCLEELRAFLGLELDTLGMRIIEPEHLPFNPIHQQTVRLFAEKSPDKNVDVRVKKVGEEDKPLSCKAEYDDLQEALRVFGVSFSLSFKTVKSAVELAATTGDEIHVCDMVFSPLKEERFIRRMRSVKE
jgi:uncharacterized protein (DUF111 family)